uniref:Uncharacterized protein n=1 Tax=Sander lucioperca TaxID=283035 RepID=A0A8C9ZRR6_SANLU
MHNLPDYLSGQINWKIGGYQTGFKDSLVLEVPGAHSELVCIQCLFYLELVSKGTEARCLGFHLWVMCPGCPWAQICGMVHHLKEGHALTQAF